MTDRDNGRAGDGASARSAGRRHIEEIEGRAARLGITPERVLQEYARIGFAKLTDIVEWDDDGIKLKPSRVLADDEVAAIAEIVAAAATNKIYRIKMHDKKPVLGAIARYLGMFPKQTDSNKDGQDDDDGEDPREFLARELARLADRRRAAVAASAHTVEDGPGAPLPVDVLGGK